MRSFILVVLIVALASGCEADTNSDNSKDLPSNIRALHVTSKDVPIAKMREIVDLSFEYNFNVLIVGFAWRGSTSLNSIPWITADYDWDPQKISAITDYAREKSITIVPHVPLLTHQELLLADHFPHHLYNSQTYYPSPELHENIIFPIVEELLDLTQSPAFLIGHDELYGSLNRPNESADSLLPPELFHYSVEELNNFLRSRDVNTWMWGDMLVGASEFPNMDQTSLLGDVQGYGKALRDQLPRDITIIDWQYFQTTPNFPTISTYVEEGFTTLGSTYESLDNIEAFSRDASARGADGMVSTIWTKVWTLTLEDLTTAIVAPAAHWYETYFPDPQPDPDQLTTF